MELSTVLFLLSFPFVLLTAYFGTKNDFYESENYNGDGCAHDVKRWYLSNSQHGHINMSIFNLSAKLVYIFD